MGRNCPLFTYLFCTSLFSFWEPSEMHVKPIDIFPQVSKDLFIIIFTFFLFLREDNFCNLSSNSLILSSIVYVLLLTHEFYIFFSSSENIYLFIHFIVFNLMDYGYNICFKVFIWEFQYWGDLGLAVVVFFLVKKLSFLGSLCVK